MLTPDLIRYAKKRLSEGANEQAVRQALLNKGWQASDVDAAISSAKGEKNKGKTEKKPARKGSRNAWLAASGLLLVAVVVIILIAFFAGPDAEEQEMGVVDCGVSLECLAEQAGRCADADASHTLQGDYYGFAVSQAAEMYVREEEGECSLQVNYLNAYVRVEPGSREMLKEQYGMDDQELEETRQMLDNEIKAILGEEHFCVGSPEQIAHIIELIKRISEGDDNAFLTPEMCIGKAFARNFLLFEKI